MIKRIVVDRAAEAGFCRRALDKLPSEFVEIIWGYLSGETAYICAFVPIDHKSTPVFVEYEDDDVDDDYIEAKSHGLRALGSLHTHPDTSTTEFSEFDLQEHMMSPDLLIGICAIETVTKNNKTRRYCRIAYWPGVMPLPVTRTDWSKKKKSKKK